MNKIAFLDELIRVGATRVLVKHADALLSDAPAGMMDSGATPDADIQQPSEVATRLPNSAKTLPIVQSGTLGSVTSPRHPIDQYRFNWGFRSVT